VDSVGRHPWLDEPSLPYLIHRIARRLDQHVNSVARVDGLKVEGIRILLRLLANDRQRVGDLAQATSIEQSALSHMLKKMETEGMIARRKEPGDSRSVLVNLTRKGARLARKYAPLFAGLEASSLDGLAATERRRLKAALVAVYQRLR
jgi:DNA-binding MarR family transcriptional regulator